MPSRQSGLNRKTLAVSVCMLAGMAVEVYSVRPRPEEATAYHDRIREVAAGIPLLIGEGKGWAGQDRKVAEEAIALLKPNVSIQRVFVHTESGRSASFVLVQSRDARDINGHYPPICYPNSGMEQVSAEAKDWTVDGLVIRGTEYRFSAIRFGRGEIIVANFILLPGGQIERDMGAVKKHAWDYLKRFHGAAQVQVVFDDPTVPETQRREMFEVLVRAHLPVIRAILSGIDQ
ncbi:MAG: EpsI family protein [Phycisphaerae bacterium]|nr:EpsI family protein [Phycisphaerae bacterium]